MNDIKQKKNVIYFLLGIMFMCIVLASGSTVEVHAAAKVQLNKKSVTLEKGKSTTLKLKGTKEKVKWTSNKKKVASVNQKGKVTAKGVGTAKITATVGGKKYTCKVKVTSSVKENYKYLANYLKKYGYINEQGIYFISGVDTVYSWVVAYDESQNQIQFMLSDESYDTTGGMIVRIKLSNYKKASVEASHVFNHYMAGYSGKGSFDPTTYHSKSTIPLVIEQCVGITNSQAQNMARLFLNVLLAEVEDAIYNRVGITLSDLGFKSWHQ